RDGGSTRQSDGPAYSFFHMAEFFGYAMKCEWPQVRPLSIGESPGMFNHIFVGTNDIESSRKFYDATMGVLGFEGHPLPHGTVYPSAEGSLIVAKPANGEAASCMNGFTLGFRAKSYDEVDAWHKAGLGAGGSDEGAPGFRDRKSVV